VHYVLQARALSAHQAGGSSVKPTTPQRAPCKAPSHTAKAWSARMVRVGGSRRRPWFARCGAPLSNLEIPSQAPQAFGAPSHVQACHGERRCSPIYPAVAACADQVLRCWQTYSRLRLLGLTQPSVEARGYCSSIANYADTGNTVANEAAQHDRHPPMAKEQHDRG
jgi:hypothetical protein